MKILRFPTLSNPQRKSPCAKPAPQLCDMHTPPKGGIDITRRGVQNMEVLPAASRDGFTAIQATIRQSTPFTAVRIVTRESVQLIVWTLCAAQRFGVWRNSIDIEPYSPYSP
jgi:hypothetical protein